ncbi:MAG: hypothetical protein C0616_10810 [Desulfuromonas sp.]|nr:MAG: hypothetical protein C0616_10810 [Desulfuromonas sp.]
MPEGYKLTALAVAATQLLYLVSGVLGPLGVMLNLLIPFPICYVLLRCGPAFGAAVVALTAGLQLAMIGPEAVVTYLLQFGIAGLVLGLLLARGGRWDRSVALCSAVVLLVAGIVAFGYVSSSGGSFDEMIGTYLDAEAAAAMDLAKSGSLDPGQLADYQEIITGMIAFLKETFVTWVAVICCGMLLLQVALLQSFSGGHYQIQGPRFTQWKAPEFLIWLLILAGFGVFYLEGTGRQVALNALLILLPVYFLQGMAVVSFFFLKKKVPPLFRTFGYVLLTMLNPFQMIVTGIGVFDLWIDFRKPRIKQE